MKSILVIEDDSIVRELIATGLAKTYKTIVAEDGELGLELAQKHLPDLIISDIAMHGLDGISLLRRLREDELTQAIPLLFLTGRGDYATIRRAMSLGADDYLLKPFDFGDLLAAIKASLLKQAQRNAKHESILRQLCQNISTSLPHELRTSVMVVQGYTHILIEEQDRLEPEIAEMIQSIKEYADRLHILAEKMYWYSVTEITQAEAIHNSLRNTLDSQIIIRDVAEQIAEKQGRRADLHLKLSPAILNCPDDFFQRIVLEIIENAFKFSYPRDLVQVSTAIEGDCFILRIKDTGRGFQPEELERINPFMQFRRDKYEQQGTGLGLSISKRLVELLAGQFMVQSSPNQFTLVTVTLPLQ